MNVDIDRIDDFFIDFDIERFDEMFWFCHERRHWSIRCKQFHFSSKLVSTVKLISEDLFRNSWSFFFFWLFFAFWEMKHLLFSMNLITLTERSYFSPILAPLKAYEYYWCCFMWLPLNITLRLCDAMLLERCDPINKETNIF